MTPMISMQDPSWPEPGNIMQQEYQNKFTLFDTLDEVVFSKGDAHMMMLDFPMLNALESQLGAVFLGAFKQHVNAAIAEYLEATTIARPITLDGTWMGARLAISVSKHLRPANLKRLTDHLKTSVEMMGEVTFEQDNETTSIHWRTRPYLATVDEYRLLNPESMLEDLSFALFDLKLRDMKSQKLSTSHLIPGCSEVMEDWSERKGALMEENRGRQWNRMGRALEIAMGNFEVPIAFHPIYEYDSKLIEGIRVEIDEVDLLLGDPHSPEFDARKDSVTASPSMLRDIAGHNAIAWKLEIYAVQEALAWFACWRKAPETYAPVRLYLPIPLTYLKPQTEVFAGIQRVLEYHESLADSITFVLSPPARELTDTEIHDLRKTIAGLGKTLGAQCVLDKVTLHGHFNQLSTRKNESLWQDLGLNEVRISNEWVDLPPNKANVALLQLMVSDLRNERVECIAPAGLNPIMHKNMHESGVRAYESGDPEAQLSPAKTEMLLRNEHTRMHRNVISAANLFGSRAS